MVLVLQNHHFRCHSSFSIPLWLQLVFHSTVVWISCKLDAWIMGVTFHRHFIRFPLSTFLKPCTMFNKVVFSLKDQRINLFRHRKGLMPHVVAFMNLWNFVLIHFWYFVWRYIIGWWVWRDVKDLWAYFELSVVTHGTLWYPERYFVGQQVCRWVFDLLLAA